MVSERHPGLHSPSLQLSPVSFVKRSQLYNERRRKQYRDKGLP